MTFLYWWVVVSYLLGFAFFFIEIYMALKRNQYNIMGTGIVILLLAPLTAWHGVLHYAQLAFCKLTNRKVIYWL